MATSRNLVQAAAPTEAPAPPDEAAARGLRLVDPDVANLPPACESDPGVWDEATCAAFTRTQYQRVYRWFGWLTRDSERAADLTQDTFAAFWASVRSGRRILAPEVWLLRIARNHWRAWCRSKRTRRPEAAACEFDAALPGPARSAWRRVAADERSHAIGVHLARLKPAYREVLVLRFWCDCQPAEIASVLGIPRPLARWRLHHALRLLRDQFEIQGVEELSDA